MRDFAQHINGDWAGIEPPRHYSHNKIEGFAEVYILPKFKPRWSLDDESPPMNTGAIPAWAIKPRKPQG